ncbi:MAG: FimV/HubP family polar landmark protein [Gammaproteobacteria bacterium]|jgi:FimV-like protein|nr:FimV/HubP family polar landmark protein [Gammaproteobacteria bacterium]
MLRKSVVILAMLLSSMAIQTFALELGAVSVESSLNQPLIVRIEILELGDTRLQDVVVRMASADDFERFNIDRIAFLASIRFLVDASGQDNYVMLRSGQIAEGANLSFVLDTRWPNGRSLTEHSVTLSPQIFQDQNADVVRQNQQAVDVQPLTTPAVAAPDQKERISGQLSIITTDSDTVGARSAATESVALDRRIVELENLLTLRQEEADRAKIEREELDSRLAALEAQIDASQEIIRLQDMQLAQLQAQLAEAAALAATEAAIAPQLPTTQASLTSNLMRILSGNTMMVLLGAGFVILLLVIFLLRRNKAISPDIEDFDELAEKEFPSGPTGQHINNLARVADRKMGSEDNAGVSEANELLRKMQIDEAVTSNEEGKLDIEGTAVEEMPAAYSGGFDQKEKESTVDIREILDGFDDNLEINAGENKSELNVIEVENDISSLGFLSEDDELEIGLIEEVKEVDLLSGADETATKLELAYAYQKMGDTDGAKEILQEVVKEGTDEQAREAEQLMISLDQLVE